MAIVRRAVELARTLRGPAGLRVRQPLARLWLARARRRRRAAARRCSSSSPTRSTSRRSSSSATSPTLVERRVKPLLPKIGKRLGRGDPGRHGGGPRRRRRVPCRRLGHARRRDAGARRGRDPGHAPTGDGRRGRRRPRRGHRHRADAGAARRGRRPRARSARSRTSAATPGSTSTTGSSCGSTACPATVEPHLPAVAAETLADGSPRRRSARRRTRARRSQLEAGRRRPSPAGAD